ncbi:MULTISPECIES: phospholipase D family protein [Deinococcus]|uniref:Phospholipase D family protein n=1 Tax=Deinococcus rufus TaxID=2136097 RepID=A0ABV7ZCD1_9DEIO|nr:phospholipase D family protein [Deinococcus sp. AB2017081]WQE94978.1 phospholipase D family protein [Deinococcus sp. AB2017081]
MWSPWDKAIGQLQNYDGDCWLVSPYITVAPTALEGIAGLATFTSVKVLTTADPQDFARSSSNLGVLQDMAGRGADVRARNRLHAKLYLRRQGNAAVGWLGSANLTDRARHTNQEVMSGPQVLDKAFLQKLDRLWDDAKRLTPEILKQLERQVVEEQANIQAQKAMLADVVVLSIEDRKAGKQFDIKHSLLKLGIDKEMARNIRTPAVSFIDAEYRDQLQDWRQEQIDRLTRGKPPLMVRLPGGNTLYACVRRNLPDVQNSLYTLDQQGAARLNQLHAGSRNDLKKKFISHLDVWRKACGAQIDKKIVAEVFVKAYEEFDKYIATDAFGVDFTLLVPVMTDDRNHPGTRCSKR